MFMATKSGLLGLWRIDRRIADARGPDAIFSGTARFCESAAGADILLMEETGHITIGTTTPLLAERRYKWCFRTATQVDVLFSDDRPFHSIDLAAQSPRARHDCAPDLYLVEYSFETHDIWHSVWTVTGPRKNYVMTSTMRRA